MSYNALVNKYLGPIHKEMYELILMTVLCFNLKGQNVGNFFQMSQTSFHRNPTALPET